ncbi:YhcH/YjgK/YiaL family protein [Mucilaginibacter sp.]|jgi:YhcH/YjgK/YiaL family protein|uniref:YhcH/YjgK/YiaL family protein n=1 Tax=Mucilaginibacter sp. TaxID=1882438 RepID=UPI003563566A
MLKRSFFPLLLSFASVLLLTLNSSAQSQPGLVLKKAFKNKAMLNGTAIVPDPMIDKETFAKQYNGNKQLWDKAFNYLTTTNLDTLSPGKHLIAGDSLYAIVIKGATKTLEQVKWESHKNYIDIQCVITDGETMQEAAPGTITPTIPYDPKTDNANYTATIGKSYLAKPGKILLFFPGIVHRAGLKADGFDTDKRIVLKIKAIN